MEADAIKPTELIRPTVLLIGAQVHTLKKIKALNIGFVLIQSRADPLFEPLVEHLFFIDSFKNLVEISRLAKQLHQLYSFRAVLSFTEYGLYPAALVAEQLELKGNTLFPVEHTRDKFKMRQLLSENQLDSLKYQYCCKEEEVHDFYKQIKSAFVLKPVQGTGSQGVCYVQAPHEIAKAWAWGLSSGSATLLAEEYIAGKEYSVESLSLDGKHQILAITEKFTSGLPHFIELGHATPASLSTALENKIHQLIKRFLDLIRQQNGPTHTEIKIDREEIKIIEAQTRIGGDQIWEMTELTTGVDAVSQTLSHLLGLEKKASEPKAKAAAVIFFAREFEEILEIHGFDTAEKQPGVLRILCGLHRGQKLGKLYSSHSRQGYILGCGTHLDEALFAVHSALEQIQVKTKPYLLRE